MVAPASEDSASSGSWLVGWPLLNNNVAVANDDAQKSQPLVVLWRQNPIFARVEEQTLVDLVGRFPDQVYEPRSLIIDAGAPADHLMVLISGTVRVFQNGEVVLRIEPFRRAMKWKDFEYEAPREE